MKLLLLLLLLCSCRSKTDWKTEQILSADRQFHSKRIIYPVQDLAREMELEFLKTQDHLYAYLNIHGIPIPPYKAPSQKIPVSIQVEGKKYSFEAILRKGGQKIQLPPSAADLIIDSLTQKLPVQIAICGYTAEVSPRNFKKLLPLMHTQGV